MTADHTTTVDGGAPAMTDTSDTYTAAWDERFAPIPWTERHRRPTPLVKPRSDTPKQIAARRRELVLAMQDTIKTETIT